MDEFLGFVHPDDRAGLQAAWHEARDGGTDYTAQYRVRRADGAYRWFLARAVSIETDGEVVGWIATMVDIDAERRARDELVASEARARGLADSLPQLVGVTAPDGALVSVNAPYTAYTGLTIDQARAMAWTATIHPDDVDAMVRSWQVAVERAEPVEMQYRLRRHDGVYRWFLNRAIPIRDAGGTITAWVGTATDIDERKRAEDALRVVVEVELALRRHARHVGGAAAAGRRRGNAPGRLVRGVRLRRRAAAAAGRDRARRPDRVRFVREYLRRYPIREGDGVALVAATGVPQRIEGITPDMYDAIADPAQRALALSLKVHAIMNVALAVDETRLGVLSLALSESERSFSDEDQQLATLIAQRASIALGNARLFERQREVARTLQASFLPSALPQAEGLEFDAVYAPGTRDLTVGGDWYDAFAYDAGSVGFSVGDVAGRGLVAAVPMGKMRQTFRALAHVERDPAHVLAVADTVLRHEHPDIFVTAFVAAYERAGGTLRYANAGHPAPFVRADGGALRRLETAGIPLGLGAFDVPRRARPLWPRATCWWPSPTA